MFLEKSWKFSLHYCIMQILYEFCEKYVIFKEIQVHLQVLFIV